MNTFRVSRYLSLYLYSVVLTFRSGTVSWSDTLLSSPLPRWPLWSNPGFPTNHMTARSDHVLPRKFDTSYQLVCTSHKNSDLWPFYEASSGFIAKAEARFRRQTRKMVPQCVSAATRSTWDEMKSTESEPVACLRQQEWCLHQSKTRGGGSDRDIIVLVRVCRATTGWNGNTLFVVRLDDLKFKIKLLSSKPVLPLDFLSISELRQELELMSQFECHRGLHWGPVSRVHCL